MHDNQDTGWQCPGMTADEWIEKLHLAPHPEGGFYIETYRSEDHFPEEALPDRYSGPRAAGTAIYYLLRAGDVSRLHHICSDEIWHFYAGDPLQLAHFPQQGSSRIVELSACGRSGSMPQCMIPGGDSFGAYVGEGGAYSLLGCTVAPGFEFVDFAWSDTDRLIESFPADEALIRRLS